MVFTNDATNDHPRIEEAVRAYVEGYLCQDASALRRVFHPDSRLMSVDEGAAEATPTAGWFDRIETKRQGGGGPLAGTHEILGIDQAGIAAVAKVRLELAAYIFTDYLSLLKTAAGWKIVHKIYEAVPKSR